MASCNGTARGVAQAFDHRRMRLPSDDRKYTNPQCLPRGRWGLACAFNMRSAGPTCPRAIDYICERCGDGATDVPTRYFTIWEGDFCLSSRLGSEGKGSEGQLVGAGHQLLLQRGQRPALDRNPVFSRGGALVISWNGGFGVQSVRGFPVARRDFQFFLKWFGGR